MKKMLCTLFFAAVITALLCGCAADSGNSQPTVIRMFQSPFPRSIWPKWENGC